MRSTVETHPEEQIATIRRPTCALMEKLKITTGLPLDHSTDSLAPPAREAFSSITSTNWPRSLPVCLDARRDTARDTPSSASSFFLITYREKRCWLPLGDPRRKTDGERKEKQVWRKTLTSDALTGVLHFLHSFRMQFTAQCILDYWIAVFIQSEINQFILVERVSPITVLT